MSKHANNQSAPSKTEVSATPKQKTNSLQAKIDRLDQLADWFYSDEFELDQALERYKQAITLAEEIQMDLKHLQNEVTILRENFAK